MPYPSKRKLHSKAASDAAQHKKTRLYAAGSCDAEPPASAPTEPSRSCDNSSGHACKADDALVTSRMNLSHGGKQPVMHNTILPNGIEQSMIFQQTDCQWGSNILVKDNLIGKPKGMKRILQERGLWDLEDEFKRQCGRAK